MRLRLPAWISTLIVLALLACTLRAHSQTDKFLYSWGDNEAGQLGLGTFTNNDPYGIAIPMLVNVPGRVVSIGAGGFQSLAVTDDGKLYSWGDNYDGELGLGTFSFSPPYGFATPQLVNIPGRVVSTAGGYIHSMAVTNDGNLYAWGFNFYGEVGNGTFTTSYPYSVAMPQLVSVPGRVVSVAAGGSTIRGDHSLAVTDDGKLYAWGYNGSGQVGNGTITPEPYRVPTPQLIGVPGRVVRVSAAWNYSLAVTDAGKVYAWGENDLGQIGNGTYLSGPPYGVATPQLVNIPGNVVNVAAGTESALAMTDTGKLYVWGYNGYGTFGDGTFGPTIVPPQLVNVPGRVVGIAAGRNSFGGNYCLAATDDGKLYAWGDNEVGQLGNGTFTPNSPYGIATPQLVNIPGRIVSLSGGAAHSLALVAPVVLESLDGTEVAPSILRINLAINSWTQQKNHLRLRITGEAKKSYKVWIEPQTAQTDPAVSDGHNHYPNRGHGWLSDYVAGDTSWMNYPPNFYEGNPNSQTREYSDYDHAKTVTTDAQGIGYVYYAASEVSGYDTIIASTVNADASQRAKSILPVHIAVPGLVALVASDDIELTGATSAHQRNHYGTPEMIAALRALARNHAAEYQASPNHGGLFSLQLPVNDMSLPLGGLFDINALWNPAGGHIGHRLGFEVDLGGPGSGHGLVPGNKTFEQIIREQGCWDINPALWAAEGNHYHIVLLEHGKAKGKPYIAFPLPWQAVWQDKANRLMSVSVPLLNRGGADAGAIVVTSVDTKPQVQVAVASSPADAPIREPRTLMFTMTVPPNVTRIQVKINGYATGQGGTQSAFPSASYVWITVPQ